MFVTKTGDCKLVPIDVDGFEQVIKLKRGEVYTITIKKERNVKFHRKFFALLNFAFDNQDKYDVLQDFRVEIQLRCGHYQEHLTVKGEIIYIPKSISFKKMSEQDFEKLYNKAIDVILKYFITGTDEETLKEAVNQIIRFDS